MLLTMPFCWDQYEVPFDCRRNTEWGLQRVLEDRGFRLLAQEKTTTYVETLAALARAYFYKHFWGNRVLLSRPMHLLVIAPILVVGAGLNKMMPNNGHLYLNRRRWRQSRRGSSPPDVSAGEPAAHP